MVKWLIVTCICLIGIAGGFVGGVISSATMGFIPIYSSDLSRTAEQTFRMMQKEALDPPETDTAVQGIINGMLTSNGDRHARYLPEEAFEKYTESMSGTFGGIGVVMEERDDNVQIVQVYEGSPAEKAGVEVGDWFYAVGDEKRDTWTSSELQLLVRGEPGTEVEITFCRPFTENDMMDMRHPLGVPFTDVVDDYLLSNQYLGPQYAQLRSALVKAGLLGDPELMRPIMEVRSGYLRAGFDEAERLYGSFGGFLTRGLGMDGQRLSKLRGELLINPGGTTYGDE